MVRDPLPNFLIVSSHLRVFDLCVSAEKRSHTHNRGDLHFVCRLKVNFSAAVLLLNKLSVIFASVADRRYRPVVLLQMGTP